MKGLPFSLGLLLAFGVGATAIAATTADFQGNCTNNNNGTQSCVFDARRQSSFGPGTHCNNGQPPTQYFWDFGNNNSLFTTSPFVSQVYTIGPTYDVSLAVFCSDNTSATRVHCMPTSFGFNGCILAGAGWTP